MKLVEFEPVSRSKRDHQNEETGYDICKRKVGKCSTTCTVEKATIPFLNTCVSQVLHHEPFTASVCQCLHPDLFATQPYPFYIPDYELNAIDSIFNLTSRMPKGVFEYGYWASNFDNGDSRKIASSIQSVTGSRLDPDSKLTSFVSESFNHWLDQQRIEVDFENACDISYQKQECIEVCGFAGLEPRFECNVRDMVIFPRMATNKVDLLNTKCRCVKGAQSFDDSKFQFLDNSRDSFYFCGILLLVLYCAFSIRNLRSGKNNGQESVTISSNGMSKV